MFGGECFPALTATCPALDRSIGSDPHMPELSGQPSGSSIYLPVDNNSSTYPVLDKDKDEITHMPDLRPAEPQFGKSCRVCIVICHHRNSGCSRDVFNDTRIEPSKIRAVEDVFSFRIDEGGKAD